MVQNPSDGNVGNAHATVAVADSSQYGEKSLEEGPVAPYSSDRVEILTGFHTYKQRKGAESVSGKRGTGVVRKESGTRAQGEGWESGVGGRGKRRTRLMRA